VRTASAKRYGTAEAKQAIAQAKNEGNNFFITHPVSFENEPEFAPKRWNWFHTVLEQKGHVKRECVKLVAGIRVSDLSRNTSISSFWDVSWIDVLDLRSGEGVAGRASVLLRQP